MIWFLLLERIIWISFRSCGYWCGSIVYAKNFTLEQVGIQKKKTKKRKNWMEVVEVMIKLTCKISHSYIHVY